MTWIIKGSSYDAKRGPRIRRHKETSWLLSDVSLGTGEQSRVDRWVYYLRSPRTKFHLSYDSAIVRLLSSSPCCGYLSTTVCFPAFKNGKEQVEARQPHFNDTTWKLYTSLQLTPRAEWQERLEASPAMWPCFLPKLLEFSYKEQRLEWISGDY